jgi:hypothetical protein
MGRKDVSKLIKRKRTHWAGAGWLEPPEKREKKKLKRNQSTDELAQLHLLGSFSTMNCWSEKKEKEKEK